MTVLWVVLGVVVVVGYVWYATIIGKRNKAREALSTIDAQLKQRFDLIPNILRIAQKYMEHERGLLGEITALRAAVEKPYDRKNAAEVKEHLAATQALSGRMGALMINVENYPTLKADQTMMQAMQTYNEVEAQITAARRFYNSAVTDLNNAVQIFPGNLIAQIAGVAEMPFFEAEEAAKQAVDASQYLK